MPLITPPPRGFYALTVADVRRETQDAVSLAFAIPEALEDTFRFQPGQYLTLRTEVDGVRLRRTYSVCSAPDAGELRVAVKRQADGRFSSFVNGTLRPGDVMDVLPPLGRFTHQPDPSAARTYLAIAAGSGITPVMSILEAVLAREPESRFVLLYGNRTSADIVFRRRLEDLKDRHLDRLSIVHVLSRESQYLAILNGRLDAPRIAALVQRLVPPATIDTAFICGPAGLIDTAEATLRQLGLPADRIKVERFTPADDAVPRRRPAPPTTAATADGPEVTLTLDGARHTLKLQPDEAIIDGAIRTGLDLPYSCKGGMCCTCRAKLVEGLVQMRECWGLEPWELEAGYVLTCQSVPQTAKVVVDYDQV